MNYTELKFITSSEFSEILMAELAEIGFETFTEEPFGLNAYIPVDKYLQENLDELLNRYRSNFVFSYDLNVIEKQNWNSEWEKNYPPIQITDKVFVRAGFHKPNPKVTFDIVINPKMSFGTGHHETTSMMMEHQLEIDHFSVQSPKKIISDSSNSDFNDQIAKKSLTENPSSHFKKDKKTKNIEKVIVLAKSVLDIGCGTGLLAILAEKLGAKDISAFDIEEWAAENTNENIELNNCKNITVRMGTIETEPLKQYDIILANINRNILLRDINQYVNYLKADGTIIISGFYLSDQADIERKFEEYNLKKAAEKTKNNWASLRFKFSQKSN